MWQSDFDIPHTVLFLCFGSIFLNLRFSPAKLSKITNQDADLHRCVIQKMYLLVFRTIDTDTKLCQISHKLGMPTLFATGYQETLTPVSNLGYLSFVDAL